MKWAKFTILESRSSKRDGSKSERFYYIVLLLLLYIEMEEPIARMGRKRLSECLFKLISIK